MRGKYARNIIAVLLHCASSVFPDLDAPELWVCRSPPNIRRNDHLNTRHLRDCVLYYSLERSQVLKLRSRVFRRACGSRLTLESAYTGACAPTRVLWKAKVLQAFSVFKCVTLVIRPWATVMTPDVDFSTLLLPAWTAENSAERLLEDLEHDFYLFSLWLTYEPDLRTVTLRWTWHAFVCSQSPGSLDICLI